MNPFLSSMPPQGLYEPSFEHDACGMGFVAHIKGEPSRAILDDALEVLHRLRHRAATGADPETGDGAGVLLQLPHRFFRRVAFEVGIPLPAARKYAVGQLMLPPEPAARDACRAIVQDVVREEGQRILGWRDVPVEPEAVGDVARDSMPAFVQVFLVRHGVPQATFERLLYMIRRRAEQRVRDAGIDPDRRFHVASLSTTTIVYKGLLLPRQLPAFYTDLRAEDLTTAIAMVHSRFSTNTLPSWDRAQPFHRICHNGEINTVRGNRNWMAARRRQLQSAKFPGGIQRLDPLIDGTTSDSAQFDSMLALLHLGGRELPHALMMMIPEAYESDPEIDDARADFYRYAETLMEPWDGPAAVAFTDGTLVGASLDRNGLRPARVVYTDDDRVILSSETGVIDIAPEHVRHRGRLKPGRMLVIDTHEGRIVSDDELKTEVSSRYPYDRWLSRNLRALDGSSTLSAEGPSEGAPPFPPAKAPPPLRGDTLLRQQRAFGYTDEDVRVLIEPMATHGAEPIGAMGNDGPLAALDEQSPPLFRYFHQLFAQVTNPPIDPIRESLVMSLRTTIGPHGNPFDETPEPCARLWTSGPILTNEAMARVSALRDGDLESTTLDMVWPVDAGPEGLERSLSALCEAASEAVDRGCTVLVLSDRAVDAAHAPMPALLAASAVHQHLIRAGSRLQTGLVVQTADAREVHDFACLLGYGVAAINPWLALDTVSSLGPEASPRAYIAAIEKGLRKILSKMGISTLMSYRGAQIFEAVGLHTALVDAHFPGTPSRIGGLGLAELAAEALTRHRRGYAPERQAPPLPVGGAYRWRRRGEPHKWNPATISALQAATATADGDPAAFERFCRLVDDEDQARCTLRGLLAFDGATPVPLDEVEPVDTLFSRFVTGAMSFGSISAEAHETLAIAMNRIGARSNSGEGGEESHRYVEDEQGDLRRSRIKQVASGRFGVTAHYLVNADDLQIKIAQGAKPGEGGQLPGHKVDERIAAVRHATPGVTLISPPPHHDIYSIEDLAQLVYDLQTVNPDARVSVKLVSEAGVGTVAAGVAKAHAGCVVIAGASGGTGASPLSSVKRAGVPWELGLAETQQVLTANGLRHRIRVQVDGGLRTGRDLAIATLLGAEEWGVATAALVVEGCVMLRKCHQNTCTVGIATQDPRLRARFTGTADRVVAYFRMLAEHLRRIMAQLGFRTVDEMVGRVDRLVPRPGLHGKASTLDLRRILARPRTDGALRCTGAEHWDLSEHLDRRIEAEAQGTLAGGAPVRVDLPITNADRAVGAGLGGTIARRYGATGLPDGSIYVVFRGSAGQSFGAFLTAGVTFELRGDANDYVGKGLSGGRLTIRPPSRTRYAPEQNVILGNVALYGATSGELFACGLAGERFAVRNSGAHAVVEGVGDHGCEYMTGGRVLVLGPTGRNFAAGMSGGVAYVLDTDGAFRDRCNLALVDLGPLDDEQEAAEVRGLLERHVSATGSPLGQRCFDDWATTRRRIVRVMPTEYQQALRKAGAA